MYFSNLLKVTGIILLLTTNFCFANPKVKMSIVCANQKANINGDIVIELYQKKAPETVKNFLNYVNSGFYDNTIFHRVINNFMIQGGGFNPNMQQKVTSAPIKNEANNKLSNLTGTIAMARTSVIDSATSQFFINVADNTFLDHRNNTSQGYGYAVFGKVIEGMSLVNKLKAVKTKSVSYYRDVPEVTILIKKVTEIKEK